jgi:transcriptional regulator with GAF, ATPase, and Fis domain
LRVLQEREFERVGGTESIHVDVRVVAATNRDLRAGILNAKFRSDLFYRLNVFPIEVPPLRERKDDIPLLLEYFVKLYAARTHKKLPLIDDRTFELFRSYDWPGNIRELQNVVERSVILTQSDVLSVDDALSPIQSSQLAGQGESSRRFKSSRDEEREIIEAALAESRGRISGSSGAAAKLKIPPSTLEHRIRALKISKIQFRYQN